MLPSNVELSAEMLSRRLNFHGKEVASLGELLLTVAKNGVHFSPVRNVNLSDVRIIQVMKTDCKKFTNAEQQVKVWVLMLAWFTREQVPYMYLTPILGSQSTQSCHADYLIGFFFWHILCVTITQSLLISTNNFCNILYSNIIHSLLLQKGY